jgi:multisubunit Na+/H+ antiporter MnhF subunit
MNALVTVSLVLLSFSGTFTMARLLKGPTLADRVVATDHLLTLVVLGIGVGAVATRDGIFVEAMLMVAVVGFLATAMVARFIEGRGQ